MGFVPIQQKFSGRGTVILDDKIRLIFLSKDSINFSLKLTIGSIVGKRIGLKDRQKICISIDEDNPFYWQIKKAEIGCTVSCANGHQFYTQIKWHGKTPKNINQYIFANWEIIDGAVELKFCQDQVKDDIND